MAFSKFIVRTHEKEVSADKLPPEIKNKMAQLGINFTEQKDIHSQHIEAEEKHGIHFKRRIEALHAGAQFLLDSLDMQDNVRAELKSTLDKHKKTYDGKLDTLSNQSSSDINLYQEELAQYTNNLKKILISNAFIPKKDVTKLLSRAEEYANLQKGRQLICTVTEIEIKQEKHWIIQSEKPLDPLSEEKKREFLKIIQEKKPLPEWFTIMPKEEQELFKTTFKDAKNSEDIAQKASTISSKLRSIPGVANFSCHTFIVMKENGTIVTEDHRLRSSMVSSRDLLKTKATQKTRLAVTEHNIKQVIEQMLEEKIKEQVNLLSPGETEITIPVLLQTLITPFKNPDKDLFKDKEAAIKQLMENKEFMTQTRVIDGQPIKVKLKIIATNHPLNPGRFVSPTMAISGKQASLEETKTEASFYHLDKDAKEIAGLIDLAQQFVQKHQHTDNKDVDKVRKAAMTLEDALKKPFIVSDRELHISALEELTVSLLGGISHGTCVSGKDRKALETIYTDAMRLYLDIYGEIPPMSMTQTHKEVEDRKKFVELFAQIYVTRHQHEHAGQNAPGADGIKTPHLYLPKDILAAIVSRSHNNSKTHEECDRLASNNEIKEIKIKKSMFKKIKVALFRSSIGFIMAHLIRNTKNTKQPLQLQSIPHPVITPEKEEKNIKHREEEKNIIKEIRKTLPNTASMRIPVGIRKIIALIDSDPKLKTVTLTDIASICSDRLNKTSKTRTPPTTDFYKMVQTLALNQDSVEGLRALNALARQQASRTAEPASKLTANSRPNL